jgi:hypothetical protein
VRNGQTVTNRATGYDLLHLGNLALKVVEFRLLLSLRRGEFFFESASCPPMLS